jgi:hypothetical protein
MRAFGLVIIGVAIGVTFTAVAAPADILASHKAPKAGQAVGLPVAASPPTPCGASTVGWMYADVDMPSGGTATCVCNQNKDRTWRWAALASGGEGLAGARECE